MTQDWTRGPLSGIKIVDLTTMISGPLCSMILADQGANVVKVETPAGGDHSRQVANRRAGYSSSFLNNNRNKRSIALDLKSPGGRAALLRLADGADLFMQNFRPGVIERLGFGAEALQARNPGLVHLSIAGFGFTGPYAGKPVFDPLIQALSGLATVQAGSDAERPRLVRTILPDKLTAFAAAQAVSAALMKRARGGPADVIRIAMLDVVISFLWSSDMGARTFLENEPEAESAQSFIDLIYETADGWISVAVMRRKEWEGLARAAGRPEWLEDPRFKTSAGLDEHKAARLELTQAALREAGAAEWLARLEAEDVPCAPVLTRREMLAHPQVAANELLRTYAHPAAGPLRQARPAPRFGAAPWPDPRPAPALGGDTREILAELGYGPGEIAELIASGAAVAAAAQEESAG